MSAPRGDSRGAGTTKKPISPSAVNLIYLKIWGGGIKRKLLQLHPSLHYSLFTLETQFQVSRHLLSYIPYKSHSTPAI